LKNIESIIEDVLRLLQADLKEELRQQGHRLTGRLEDSLKYTVEASSTVAVGRMFAEDYGIFVELGVRASRIPFSGNRQGGGGKRTSFYIQGLISFWEKRGLSGREAVSAAFATAHVHKREGMPSRRSYAFSSTGERTGFVRAAVERNLDKIGQIIEEKYGATIELEIAQQFNERIRIAL